MIRGRNIGAAALLLLAGCGSPEPEGQVAARVAGIEITNRELAGEAALTGADLNRQAARTALLDRLIDRKLLARAAQDSLADRTPATQLEARRTREEVLARAYAQRIAAALPQPTAAEVDRFMRRNPHRFAARTNLLLDRLSLTATPGAPAIDGLSADAAARALTAAATPYRRRLVLLDSDLLSAAEYGRLGALDPGETLTSGAGGTVTHDTLIDRRPIVEPEDAQRSRARNLLVHSRATAAVRTAVASLRAEADIAIRQPARAATER